MIKNNKNDSEIIKVFFFKKIKVVRSSLKKKKKEEIRNSRKTINFSYFKFQSCTNNDLKRGDLIVNSNAEYDLKKVPVKDRKSITGKDFLIETGI